MRRCPPTADLARRRSLAVDPVRRSFLAAGSGAEELLAADLVSSGGGSPGWAQRAYLGFFFSFFLFF
jgi:hypothetical protein